MGWPASFDGRPADLGMFGLSLTAEIDRDDDKQMTVIIGDKSQRHEEIARVRSAPASRLNLTVTTPVEAAASCLGRLMLSFRTAWNSIMVVLWPEQFEDLYRDMEQVHNDTHGQQVARVEVHETWRGIRIDTYLESGNAIPNYLPNGITLDDLKEALDATRRLEHVDQV